MGKTSEPDLLETGIYTIPEVAELVQAPQDVVRVWVEGHTGKQVAVIDNQLGRVGGKVSVSAARFIVVVMFQAAALPY
jgi:hypothetical protein